MVTLIRKNRPEWQAGKLNGVGGHVERGESYHECMVREFQEEAGVLIPEWTRFARVKSPNATVVFFQATVPTFDGVETKTDEAIVFRDGYDVPHDVVPNLHWLIPMARSNEPLIAEVKSVS